MECTMNMCERVRIFIKGKGGFAIFKLQHIVYLLHYVLIISYFSLDTPAEMAVFCQDHFLSARGFKGQGCRGLFKALFP